MTKKAYVFMLTETDRKRHEHMSDKGRVVEFIVQYETKLQDKWVPVIRYDTAHGFAHKDILNPDGTSEKILLGNVNYNELLTFAERDINENWQRYKDRYIGRIKHD
jgi:hypothetical protein